MMRQVDVQSGARALPLTGISRRLERPRGRAAGLAIFSGTDSLLAVALVALATGLLVYLPSAFGVDSWLALVTGRDIWQHGIPQHEGLTVIVHGVRWVDQQWLSQLASYALYRLGGLGLLGLVNVALIVGTIAGAAACARRRGTEARTVMLLLPLCVWLIVPAREVRTQELVLPLFAATVYLLAGPSTSSRRVYWCLPILILWANLHGSAGLGAGLIVLRGVTLAWERRGDLRRLRPWVRPAALLAAPLCLLITPYGFHIVSYYRDTLFNSALRHSVTEWQPITSSGLISVPFLLLAGIMIWSFGRQPDRTTPWERLALLALAMLSVSVIRNVAFFAICALALVPRSVEGTILPAVHRQAQLRPRVNGMISLVALAALLIATISTLARPDARFEAGYQQAGVLRVVEAATLADPSVKVFADSRFADWLLWRDTALAGRIDYDVRYELLSAQQIMRIQRTLSAIGPAWKQGARGYRLLVLDKGADADSVAGFLAEPGRRVLYEDSRRIVILRPAGPAA